MGRISCCRIRYACNVLRASFCCWDNAIEAARIIDALAVGVRGYLRGLQRVANGPLRGARQALDRHRRARNVAAQPLELLALLCLGGDSGVQREAVRSCHALTRAFFPPRRQTLQQERFRPLWGPNAMRYVME
jgi:hypothetical protein